MTLNEIVVKTGGPKDYLIPRLNLPAEVDSRAPIREWMHKQGKSVQDVREEVRQFRTK